MRRLQVLDITKCSGMDAGALLWVRAPCFPSLSTLFLGFKGLSKLVMQQLRQDRPRVHVLVWDKYVGDA